MKDHPRLSEEEAPKHVYDLMENSLTDFKVAKDVLDKWKRLVFDNAKSM